MSVRRRPLLLDEMFAPKVAQALRERRHDVIAVAERVELRELTDEALFGWAASQGRWVLTENVKDFRPILVQAVRDGAAVTGLLFTSTRSFPRSRRNLGPLVEALDRWLRADRPETTVLSEDWLVDERSRADTGDAAARA